MVLEGLDTIQLTNWGSQFRLFIGWKQRKIAVSRLQPRQARQQPNGFRVHHSLQSRDIQLWHMWWRDHTWNRLLPLFTMQSARWVSEMLQAKLEKEEPMRPKESFSGGIGVSIWEPLWRGSIFVQWQEEANQCSWWLLSLYDLQSIRFVPGELWKKEEGLCVLIQGSYNLDTRLEQESYYWRPYLELWRAGT